MTNLDFAIVDADNHYYEPDDCFTRHIEAGFADQAVHIRRADPATASGDGDSAEPIWRGVHRRGTAQVLHRNTLRRHRPAGRAAGVLQGQLWQGRCVAGSRADLRR